MTENRRLSRFLHTSEVVDEFGNPLIVYRGEHGAPDKRTRFKTRLGSISFGSEAAARYYSCQPNRNSDWVVAPRLISAFLSIRRPVMNRAGDPFIEFSEIEMSLGSAKALEMALRLAPHIENTNNWVDYLGREYETVSAFLLSSKGGLEELYVDAYPVFDDIEFVQWFRSAGFDGAIHGGTGITAGETEYKIFSASQAYSCA